MVELAIILGIYGYLIFALGLLGRLGKLEVLIISIPFLIWGIIGGVKRVRKIRGVREIKKDKLVLLILILLGIQILINFLGAISPELSFDALWYHLTPAKLYVQNHQIYYIPGWLMWPANLPRLGDMYYTVALLFSNEIAAKLIHFAFGLLGMFAMFQMLRRYLTLRFALLGVLTFYTMLIIGWQSTTAYIDLTRTFFEILALDLFLKWYESTDDNFLLDSAVMVGLAISTKILALGTLGILGILILFLGREGVVRRAVKVGKFLGISLLITVSWFIFLYIHNGGLLIDGKINGLNNVFQYFWNATLRPDDIISPIYLIFLPLVLINIWKESPSIKIAALYFLLNILIVPNQSNRYLLPYLPALTLVVFSVLQKQKNIFILFTGLIIGASFLNLGSRVLATKKFVPYLFGRESKSEFLSRNLNFGYGDFYDTDFWFAKNIDKNDLVLVYGIHNLYYLNFPYVHESWAKKGTYFNYILVGNNENLPTKFGNKILIYQNVQTGVKVYLFGEKYE